MMNRLPVLFLLLLISPSCENPDITDSCRSSATEPGGSSPGSSSCPSPRVTDGCKTTVAVRVSGGITPQIDWTPACGMNRVLVRTARADGQGGAVFWSFSAPGRLIGPGLVYGNDPDGALLESPTRVLQVGTTYRVFLQMIEEDDVITGQGTTTFTP